MGTYDNASEAALGRSPVPSDIEIQMNLISQITWVPLQESRPPRGVRVLVTNLEYVSTDTLQYDTFEDREMWAWSFDREVTHWAYFPAPPFRR